MHESTIGSNLVLHFSGNSHSGDEVVSSKAARAKRIGVGFGTDYVRSALPHSAPSPLVSASVKT